MKQLVLPCVLATTLFGCGGGRLDAVPASPVAQRYDDASFMRLPATIVPGLTVRKIAPSTFVVTDETFFSSNVLVARMNDGSLVIASSPADGEATRAMLQWFRKQLAPPKIIAINTHFHFDGTGGNAAYIADGVEVVASRRTMELLDERGPALRTKLADSQTDPALKARVRANELVHATRLFDVSLTLDFDGEVVRVIYPGPAHSPDNLVVHFPARRILFGGCMIKTGRDIGYTGDADVARWEAAVHAIEPLAADIVVAGHGPVGGRELFQNTIDVVRATNASKSPRTD